MIKSLRETIENGQFINAVKCLREKKSCRLSDAKHFCDKIRENYSENLLVDELKNILPCEPDMRLMERNTN